MSEENKVPDFSKLARRLLRDVVRISKREGETFFKNSFQEGGFTDSSFTPWPKRRGHAENALLSKTMALRDSVKSKSNSGSIEFYSDLPYSKIHNEGGIIKISEKQRGKFWRLYRDTGNAKWKAMALSKELKIPQRQYIGESEKLMELISDNVFDHIETQLKKIFKE